MIFPHPDDEALSISGTASMLAAQGIKVTYIFLTKGERGTKDASEDKNLKHIRGQEAQIATDTVGAQLIHKDFGDGQLQKKRSAVKKYLKQQISDNPPDILITFDPSGLYGHPDHIVTSDIITQLKPRKSRLLYVSYPTKMLNTTDLPEHMAESTTFANQRRFPTHKNIVLSQLLTKIRVLYAYRSQHHAFKSSFPRGVPLWLIACMSGIEYIHEVS